MVGNSRGGDMNSSNRPQYNALFATDQDCISYLFQKRWPSGFQCPFCGRCQKEIAPAHTVVCRYCRKQTSITANTLMHGSKKSLSEWMQVAAQFCFSQEGISARSLQKYFHIPTYQTAWKWLRKLRKAAAIAEATPLQGPVHLMITATQPPTSSCKHTHSIACLMEAAESAGQPGRIRLTWFSNKTANKLPEFITQVVPKGAIIIASAATHHSLLILMEEYYLQSSDQENMGAAAVIDELQRWMRLIYRGATDSKYLQDYLDEFCFRHNTASWNNQPAILDHLLTGIMGGNAAGSQSLQSNVPGR